MKLLPSIIIRMICIYLVYSLVILSRIGKGILAFFIAEAVVIAIFSIGNICDALASNKARLELLDVSFTSLGFRKIVFTKIVGSNLYNLIFLFISAAISLSTPVFWKGIGFWRIAYSNIVTFLILITVIAISFFFSMVYRNKIFYIALTSYLMIFILISSVLLPVPFIERIQSQKLKDIMTRVSFYANPIIMLTRSFGKIDIMRTEYMYSIADPVVSRGFSYPDWRIMAVIYTGVSLILFSLTFILVGKLEIIYWLKSKNYRNK